MAAVQRARGARGNSGVRTVSAAPHRSCRRAHSYLAAHTSSRLSQPFFTVFTNPSLSSSAREGTSSSPRYQQITHERTSDWTDCARLSRERHRGHSRTKDCCSLACAIAVPLLCSQSNEGTVVTAGPRRPTRHGIRIQAEAGERTCCDRRKASSSRSLEISEASRRCCARRCRLRAVLSRLACSRRR